MKGKKGIVAAALCAALALCASVFLTACTDPKPAAVTIGLDKTEASVDVGDMLTLTPTVTGAEIAEIVWTSSDEEVAEVANGEVTGIGEGSATISAKVQGAEATCAVTVTSDLMPTLTLDRETVELLMGGESVTAAATVRYGDATVAAAVSWSSENPAVAAVDGGVISPVGVGETTITAETTYRGKHAEQTLAVKVSPDLTISVSLQEVELTTYKLQPADKVTEEIDVQVVANGETLTDAEIDVKTEGDAAEVSAAGNKVTVTAKEPGTAKITLTYRYDSQYSTKTEIAVTVRRPVLELTDPFTLNVNDKGAALDLDSYDWKDGVLGIYAGETLISETNTPTMISKTWLSAQTPGTTYKMKFVLEDYDVTATLNVKDDYATAELGLAEQGRDGSTFEKYTGNVQELGFAAGDSVMLWGAKGNLWNDRLGNLTDLVSYDYWIFDISLTQELEKELAIWIGSGHVMKIMPGGQVTLFQGGPNYSGSAEQHLTETCVRIFDAENKIVVGKLKPGVKYNVEVKLAHRGSKALYEIGAAFATNIYVANSFACTEAYYNEAVAPLRDVTLPELSVTVEKNIPATHTLDFTGHSWKDSVEGLYVEDVKISRDGAPNAISETWLTSAADGVYLMIVQLNDGERVNAALEIKTSMIEIGYHLPDRPGHSSFTPYEGAVTDIGFAEGDTVYTYASSSADHWGNRIHADPAPSAYDWWIFDLALSADVFEANVKKQAFTLWIGSTHVLFVYSDGSVDLFASNVAKPHEDSCLKIYDANGAPATSLKANQKYTFEISLAHKGSSDSLFEMGMSTPATYYIGNSFACTDEYYREYVAAK